MCQGLANHLLPRSEHPQRALIQRYMTETHLFPLLEEISKVLRDQR